LRRSSLATITGAAAYPWRTGVGLAAVILAAFLSLLQTTQGMPWIAVHPRDADAVSRSESRFRPLRQLLPPRAVVGYVSDAASADGREEFRRYILAQYALAPVIVIDNATFELVVGDFECVACRRNLSGLTPIWDGGEGVVLFARSGT
jgi:hypothetical protein